MAATLHVAAPLHHPFAAFTAWLTEHFHHRQPTAEAAAEFVQALDIEALRLSLPVVDPDRHALENPALEDAFAHLAVDHPTEVALSCMRPADREELLLAVCDDWFRHAHPAPEHRWPPAIRAEYELLLGSVRACFQPTGGVR